MWKLCHLHLRHFPPSFVCFVFVCQASDFRCRVYVRQLGHQGAQERGETCEWLPTWKFYSRCIWWVKAQSSSLWNVFSGWSIWAIQTWDIDVIFDSPHGCDSIRHFFFWGLAFHHDKPSQLQLFDRIHMFPRTFSEYMDHSTGFFVFGRSVCNTSLVNQYSAPSCRCRRWIPIRFGVRNDFDRYWKRWVGGLGLPKVRLKPPWSRGPEVLLLPGNLTPQWGWS